MDTSRALLEFSIVSALIGTTLIIVRGTIFKPLQNLWPAFFRCSQCVGMWVGVVAGAGGLITTGHGLALDAFMVGAATSVWSLGVDAVLAKLLE